MAQDFERTTWSVKAAAGEPLAVISVRDLQTTTHMCADAWGRQGKEQPILVTAELWLAQGFPGSSASDQVANDTVHYGILAKGLLSALKSAGKPGTRYEAQQSLTLRQLIDHIIREVKYPSLNGQDTGRLIFSDSERLKYSRVTATLPKGSLLGVGEGVSLSHHQAWPSNGSEPFWSDSLQLRQLRVPTLVGVNDNERTAKQVVVADIEVDNFDDPECDDYPTLERIAVQTMEESSFETLEALAAAIATRLAEHLRSREKPARPVWQIKVTLEKPTAIPMAQAAHVEYRSAPNAV
ncbi:FolB domain-containing protein [Plectosphaerella cucumerina]|uniref:dihydroneopterin aldolase n=1 Tax=Plectosphaerella cucumerina TaxID=40658 RepID=A0A8K0TGF2_9PEZI|nr:FolB domain-containing protein [Plectosphaerella cucumerina]